MGADSHTLAQRPKASIDPTPLGTRLSHQSTRRSWELFDLDALLRRVQLSLCALGLGERPIPLQIVGCADEEGDVGDVVGVTGRHPHTVAGTNDKTAPLSLRGVTGRIQVGDCVGGRPGWRVCSGDGETKPGRAGWCGSASGARRLAVEAPALTGGTTPRPGDTDRTAGRSPQAGEAQ